MIAPDERLLWMMLAESERLMATDYRPGDNEVNVRIRGELVALGVNLDDLVARSRDVLRRYEDEIKAKRAALDDDEIKTKLASIFRRKC